MSGPKFATGLDEMPTMADVSSLTGLEFMTKVKDGELAAPPIGRTLGFRVESVKDGEVCFIGTPNFDALNPLGTVHGGWFGALLDSCMACAVQTKLAKGQGYTTQEYKVNLIRPLFSDSGAVMATGQVQHSGRRTGVAVGEIRGIEDGKLYATGSTTCLIFPL